MTGKIQSCEKEASKGKVKHCSEDQRMDNGKSEVPSGEITMFREKQK